MASDIDIFKHLDICATFLTSKSLNVMPEFHVPNIVIDQRFVW